MTMEEVREPRVSGASLTPARVMRHKLDLRSELAVRFGFKPGDVLRCAHTVPVRSNIEKSPVPSSRETCETEYLTIQGGENVTLLGPEFDYWTGKMFLAFLCDDRVVYYNYWMQHQAGDTMFQTTFKKVIESV